MIEVTKTIEAIREAVVENVREQIALASQGRVIGRRAAQSSYLLVSEAVAITGETVARSFRFKPDEFGAWLRALPDVARTSIEQGFFLDQIEATLRAALATSFKPQVQAMVAAQYAGDTIGDVLRAFEQTVDGDLSLIPRHIPGWSVQSRIDGYREDPTPDMLEMLIRHIASTIEALRGLTNTLDIADPPSADVAGRVHRQLEESFDRLVLVIAQEQKAKAATETLEEPDAET